MKHTISWIHKYISTRARTDYANDKLILDTINTHNKRIVHDVDVREELSVIEECAAEEPLGVLSHIKG